MSINDAIAKGFLSTISRFGIRKDDLLDFIDEDYVDTQFTSELKENEIILGFKRDGKLIFRKAELNRESDKIVIERYLPFNTIQETEFTLSSLLKLLLKNIEL